MANMRMAKKSSSPICSSGTMAFMMDLSTTCKPGVREQQSDSRRGSIKGGALRVNAHVSKTGEMWGLKEKWGAQV